MKNDQIAQISSSLIRKRDDIILSILSRHLNYQVNVFNVMHLKGRLSSNINAHGYETFYIDGVRLVCFHPCSTDMANDGMSYTVGAEVKYEVYI